MSLSNIWAEREEAKEVKKWKKWTKEDEQELRRLWKEGLRVEEIAEKMYRTETAIKSHSTKLKLKGRVFVRLWDDEMTEILKSNYKTKSDEELSEMIGVSVTQIIRKRQYLRLGRFNYKSWSKEEDAYIRKNRDKSNKELQKALNRTAGSIRAKLWLINNGS